MCILAAMATCVFAQAPAPQGTATGGRGRVARGGGGMLDQAGSADKHILDEVAAERGKKVYIAECITCHGASARGGSVPPNDGPDLVRSLTVLHDRYGSTVGPFILKNHPMQSGRPASSLSQAQRTLVSF